MRQFFKCKGFEDKDILMPKRSTKYSAGYDIACHGSYAIQPGEMLMIPTGLKVKMAENEVLKMYARSSLAIKKGLFFTNGVAIIDSDYFENENNDGHIHISLYNFTNEVAHIEDKERLAQGIFVKYETTIDDEVTATRSGGFGSTGNK